MTKDFHVDKPDEVLTRIAGAFGYTGRTFRIRPVDASKPTVTVSDLEWSGGSRSYWHAIRLESGEVLPLTLQPTVFGGPPVQNTVNLQPGIALAEHVIFCGKDHGIVVYVRTDNLTPSMLPAPQDTSRAEAIVLDATASLKASYGGVKDFRFVEAHERTGITRAEWDTAKAALIAKGLLNKAGAITPAGRNARVRVQVERRRADGTTFFMSAF